MKKKIPNILTLTRIGVLPLFLLIPLFDSLVARWIFLIIFTYASVTDFLDGYLARIYNSTSTFGRIFDSLADKMLVIIVAILLALRNHEMALIIILPTILIIFRELLISGVRETLAEKNITLASTMIAKFKTTGQLISLGFLIIGGKENLFYVLLTYVGIILLYTAMLLSLLSGWQYITKIKKYL